MGKFFGALGGNLEKTQLHQFWILLENKIIILEVLETFFFLFANLKNAHNAMACSTTAGFRVTGGKLLCCARLPPVE